MLILNLNEKQVIFATANGGIGFGRFNNWEDYQIEDVESVAVENQIHGHILLGDFRLSEGV